MRTTIDLINFSPSVPLNDDVPEKFWTVKEVSYDHLRVFSCRAFVHIPKDERSKLDPKAKECIFLGYGHEEFGYKLYDPVDKKVVRSRDVTPQTRGSVDYQSTRGIQVVVGSPDTTSETRVESPLYGELYQNTSPA